MISANKIIEEISKHRYSLFKTFFPKSKYNFILKKIKNFKKFEKFKTFGYELKNTEFVDLNTEDDLKKLKIYFKK